MSECGFNFLKESCVGNMFGVCGDVMDRVWAVVCNMRKLLGVIMPLFVTLLMFILVFIKEFVLSESVVSLAFFFILLFFPVWGPAIYALYGVLLGEGSIGFCWDEDREGCGVGWRRLLAVTLLSLGVVTLITAYRYCEYSVPQGFDTSYYYITLTRIGSLSGSRFFELLFTWKRPLFLILMVFLI